jgi:sigma-E factor negative regulatory protein RseC
MAEVAVARATACGGNCGSCESCIFQSEIKTLAKNRIGAKPGQKVVIASASSKVYGAALLVYIMPLVLFIAAYAVAAFAGAGEGLRIGVSFLGLSLGAAILVLSQRLKSNKEPITFEIIR